MTPALAESSTLVGTTVLTESSVVTPEGSRTTRTVVSAVAGRSRGRVASMGDVLSQAASHAQADAPACDSCGAITVRSGTCYKCLNCGSSMGCS